jgi:hypothetical protein
MNESRATPQTPPVGSARPSLANAKTLDQRLLAVDGVMFDAEPV